MVDAFEVVQGVERDGAADVARPSSAGGEEKIGEVAGEEDFVADRCAGAVGGDDGVELFERFECAGEAGDHAGRVYLRDEAETRCAGYIFGTTMR